MKLHLAIISEHASPLCPLGGVDCGGQNVYVSQTAQRLAERGHRVDVFTRRDSPHQPIVHAWKPGLRLIRVPAGPAEAVPKEALLQYMPEFANFMREFIGSSGARPDLCHANFWMSGLVAMELKRTHHLPFVITFHALGKIRRIHQGAADQFPEIRSRIEEDIVQEAVMVIAECPQDEEDLQVHYAAAPANIAVIPCGYDPKEVWPVGKRAARAKLGVGQNEAIILQLGRIVPRKGIDNTIRGFAQLHKHRHIEGKLLVVGGESDAPDMAATPEIARLRKIAIKEGISEHVQFMGRNSREMLRYYYSAADVFVTTPWYEPFGITPVEAMACGTVVVGSRVGGIKYTVKDGSTGFLVSPDNPVELADKLERLIRQPALMARFAREGRLRAMQHFKWSHVTRSLEEVYVRALNREHTFQPHESESMIGTTSSYHPFTPSLAAA